MLWLNTSNISKHASWPTVAGRAQKKQSRAWVSGKKRACKNDNTGVRQWFGNVEFPISCFQDFDSIFKLMEDWSDRSRFSLARVFSISMFSDLSDCFCWCFDILEIWQQKRVFQEEEAPFRQPWQRHWWYLKISYVNKLIIRQKIQNRIFGVYARQNHLVLKNNEK